MLTRQTHVLNSTPALFRRCGRKRLVSGNLLRLASKGLVKIQRKSLCRLTGRRIYHCSESERGKTVTCYAEQLSASSSSPEVATTCRPPSETYKFLAKMSCPHKRFVHELIVAHVQPWLERILRYRRGKHNVILLDGPCAMSLRCFKLHLPGLLHYHVPNPNTDAPFFQRVGGNNGSTVTRYTMPLAEMFKCTEFNKAAPIHFAFLDFCCTLQTAQRDVCDTVARMPAQGILAATFSSRGVAKGPLATVGAFTKLLRALRPGCRRKAVYCYGAMAFVIVELI